MGDCWAAVVAYPCVVSGLHFIYLEDIIYQILGKTAPVQHKLQIPDRAYFPFYLQHWGLGSYTLHAICHHFACYAQPFKARIFYFAYYLQHCIVGTFLFACYLQHFAAGTFYFACQLQHLEAGTLHCACQCNMWELEPSILYDICIYVNLLGVGLFHLACYLQVVVSCWLLVVIF